MLPSSSFLSTTSVDVSKSLNYFHISSPGHPTPLLSICSIENVQTSVAYKGRSFWQVSPFTEDTPYSHLSFTAKPLTYHQTHLTSCSKLDRRANHPRAVESASTIPNVGLGSTRRRRIWTKGFNALFAGCQSTWHAPFLRITIVSRWFVFTFVWNLSSWSARNVSTNQLHRRYMTRSQPWVPWFGGR